MRVAFSTQYVGFAQMDFQFILKFESPYAEANLYASELRFVDARGARLIDIGEPVDDQFFSDFLSNTLATGTNVLIAISDEAELVMEIPGLSVTLAALPNEDYEGWSAKFEPDFADGLSMAVCAPGGKVVYFGPPQ